MNGRVFLIGAGPGDPGMLTLRGAELLRQADVVLYDGLCNPALLQHAVDADHICVGKHGQSRIWKQQEIIDEMLLHATAGRRVARLKGGDPAVFARTAEEVAALQQAGIPLEVVPGITTALAAGSFAGIPVTHRGLASAVALITGHEEPGKPQSALDWDALAKFPGTLVVYMGVTTARSWTNSLLSAGKSADTAAAIIRRCSLPDQQLIRCRLDQVADQLTPATQLRPPVIVILGPVTELADAIHWARSRPLLRQTVLVTRPADQAEALANPLRQLGAQVLVQPVIEIQPLDDWTTVDATIESLSNFDLIVFCSRNGVQSFFNRILATGNDLRCTGNLKIAAVGEKTADSLSEFHLRADIVPSDFRAESLAESLTQEARDKNVLIIRASRGRDELSSALQQGGASVTQVVTYQHLDVAQVDPSIIDLARAEKIDWITLTSRATATNAFTLFGDAMKKMKIATLSPVTSARVEEIGLQVTAEADPYTIDALIESIRKASP
jgi:uroporphyrinogen III methyltransferase/synthase